eukprot:117102_1
MAETDRIEQIKEELFTSIKAKLSEIETIEEEVNLMYKEIATLQYEGREIKSKSIEKMKDDISKCFVELESFVKNKKNELLLKVNELGNNCDFDEKFSIELMQIKQKNRKLINESNEYLNNKMAECEYLNNKICKDGTMIDNKTILSDINIVFNESMNKFNESMNKYNKMIDRISIKESYKFQLNSTIYKSVLNNIVNVGIIKTIIPSKDGDLIIRKGERCELKSNYQYEFNNIILSENSKLTVKSWNCTLKTGGMLFIKCLNKFILEKNSKITLSYKGYKGGNPTYQGESYNNKGNQKLNKPNFGGGGTGISGAGGGYGTFGLDGKYSNGGNEYGNNLLTSMYMGSGGGASEKCNGGNGGGSIWLYCLNEIQLKENSFISSNGQNGKDANLLEKGAGGGGSGGSIFIECKQLKLSSTSNINAFGGKGGKATKPFGYDAGNGGNGRICIKVKGVNSIGYMQNITPQPFVEYS